MHFKLLKHNNKNKEHTKTIQKQYKNNTKIKYIKYGTTTNSCYR